MIKTRLFSYVVDHDTGYAPNPYFGFCTLCRCKYRKSKEKPRNVVELAKPGDWIVGTGGANHKKSAGHHKLVYAMKVEKKIMRGEYFRSRAFACKKRSGNKGDIQFRGDNLRPKNQFEDEGQYVLISKKHFYYFGDEAISIPPDKFPHLEKLGPSFRSNFDEDYVQRFEEWITEQKRGRHGEPCQQSRLGKRNTGTCKSSF